MVGTVEGASDEGGSVTQYRFTTAPSGAALAVQATANSVSSDGYFEIDNTGQIILTEKGWAATVNDYDDTQISFDYYIQAGDQAGNWSDAQKISLSLKDLSSGTGSTVYLSLDRTGVWYDTDKDGKRDTGETAATLIASGDFWRVKDVEMEVDNVSLRVVDRRVATPLDIKGFGSGDKLIIDWETSKNDWYNLAKTYWWAQNQRPEFSRMMIDYNREALSTYASGPSIGLYTYRLQRPGVFGYYVDYSHVLYPVQDGSGIFGKLRQALNVLGTRTANGTYYKNNGFTSVTKLVPYNSITYIYASGGIRSMTNTYTAAKGLGAGHTVEVIKPRFSTTISIGRDGAWIDTNANGLRDGSEALLETTTSSGYDVLNGIDFASGTYDIRFVDAYNIPKLDLTGFDGDDKIIIDLVTSQADWMNVRAWFTTNAKTLPVPAPTSSVGQSKYASLVKANTGPNYNLSFYPSARGTYSVLGRQAYGPTVNGVGRYITTKPNGGIALSIAKIDLGSNFEVILA